MGACKLVCKNVGGQAVVHLANVFARAFLCASMRVWVGGRVRARVCLKNKQQRTAGVLNGDGLAKLPKLAKGQGGVCVCVLTLSPSF